jgi:hypothetical protein
MVCSLPSLGYADAPADDLSDCFDFKQTPLTFQKVAAQYEACHFLNDKRPPGDPDNDGRGGMDGSVAVLAVANL